MARILDVAQKLAQPHDLLHMLGEVVDAGMSVLSADRASPWFFEPANGGLVMKVPDLKPPPCISMGAGLGVLLSTHKIWMSDNSGLELVNVTPTSTTFFVTRV